MDEIFRILWSLGRIFIFLVIPAAACTRVIQKIYKKPLDSLEFLAIGSALGIFFLPMLSLVSIKILPYEQSESIFIILSLLGAILLTVSWQRVVFLQREEVFLLLIFCAITAGLIWYMTHAYYPLPDLDPYYWLNSYAKFISSYASTATIVPDRPGFFGFLFLWNKIFAIDQYALLKYVIPLLFTSGMLPLALITKTIKDNLTKIAVMIALFWSSSTFLYAITPMPQAIYILALLYAVCFLLYARITGKNVFSYLAGGILLITALIHEISALPFLAWLLFTLWNKRILIIGHAKKTPIIAVLLGIILIDHSSLISNTFKFIWHWTTQIAKELSFTNPNLLFPTYYINVDGMEVGWAGFEGIIKYYLYYVGPSVITLLAFILYLCTQKEIRKIAWREIKNHHETQIALSIAILFFTISEILPRTASIALLPERAWISTSIVLIYPFVLIMKKQPIATQRILSSIFIALTLISIGGAIFINEQKKFLIPSYQLNSAAWIKENLPQNRTIISDGNKNLLTFHSVSRLIVIPKLYCDNTYKDPENILSLSSSHITDPNREQLKMNLLSDIQQYVQNAKMILSADIEAISSNYAHQINREPLQENNPEENMYIYYYSDDPRNPYVDRPYVKSRKDCSTPVFDQNPEHYKRIYHDGDRVIIWQVQ